MGASGAEREHCELVTADDKLVKNLQTSFPFIKSLSSLPETVPPPMWGANRVFMTAAIRLSPKHD
jgi:hypothetical protein